MSMYFDLDLGIRIESVKQAIKGNSVGSRHMSQCGTSAFDYDLNHDFNIVLKKHETLHLKQNVFRLTERDQY